MAHSRLLEPVDIGRARARNRLLFGPHVTNLGTDKRELSDRHIAYYRRRASGGCGTIVIEEASVHSSDWPYERSPLAERCTTGWQSIARVCHDEGSLVIAAIGHAGGQGSSAFHQQALLAPSRVPEVNSREVPKWMEPEDIEAITAGFAHAASTAIAAGCDGVEVNVGQHSLIRQFLSGLTNHRADEWGTDRQLFLRQILHAVTIAARAGNADAVVGVRLCCDELAPWAGITAEHATQTATDISATIDYLVVVRGSIFSVEKTRPDFHEPPGFNVDLCRAVKAATKVVTFLQGSVVDAAQAEWAIAEGVCDGVEMTRAQIADPDLGAKLVQGTPEQIRPCIRCNQTCQVRDGRNPIVTCVGEPSSGHETTDPEWYAPTSKPRDVLVVGGGPAGLETARVAAARGHKVRLVERAPSLGGVAAVAGPGRALTDWLEAECRRLGVELVTNVEKLAAVDTDDRVVVTCIGGRPGRRSYEIADGAVVVDVLEASENTAPTGPVAVHDPIGGPIGVAMAERLGRGTLLITGDNIAGNELARTGDLAPANVRLLQAGVQIERRSILRAVRRNEIELEDRFTGARRLVEIAGVVDCGFRLPNDSGTGQQIRAGDCVAPRTIAEAVLEGRRAAMAIDRVR